jgi:hypothetical protein
MLNSHNIFPYPKSYPHHIYLVLYYIHNPFPMLSVISISHFPLSNVISAPHTYSHVLHMLHLRYISPCPASNLHCIFPCPMSHPHYIFRRLMLNSLKIFPCPI